MDEGRRIVLHKRQERAREAESVFKNPAFVEACRQVEASCIKEWTRAEGDTESRERAYFELKALKAVLSRLQATIRDEAIVKMELAGMDRQVEELIGG